MAVQRARYMTLETIAPISDDPIISLPAMASRCVPAQPNIDASHRQTHTTLFHVPARSICARAGPYVYAGPAA